MQSKKESLIEVSLGTTVGLVGSTIITFAVVSLLENDILVTVVNVGLCTVWSLFRNYQIRRYYERKIRNVTNQKG
jgi:hypothetical protein